jgi:hypothetical protein
MLLVNENCAIVVEKAFRGKAMAIHEITQDDLVPLKVVTFASQNILERKDLQRILRTHIEAIAPGTLVLAEEFSDWEGSGRSIDLLCVDRNANLVVVELKRTEDGGHMELQAIRYAAMISKMTFADAVEAHAKFLAKIDGDETTAENSILTFLGWDEPKASDFGLDVRIVLVSADFKKEITTSVMWLNERDLDIRCVRLTPYQFMGKTLLDIQQVLPLPEAAEYQIRLKKKAAEERKSQEGGADWTRYDLKVGELTFPKLYKRGLFLFVIRALVADGKTVAQLEEFLPTRKFLGLPGKLTGDEFRKQASDTKTPSGAAYDLRRFYVGDGDLFFSEEKTWALSNQWSIQFLPHLDQLIAKHPDSHLSYSVANQTDDE